MIKHNVLQSKLPRGKPTGHSGRTSNNQHLARQSAHFSQSGILAVLLLLVLLIQPLAPVFANETVMATDETKTANHKTELSIETEIATLVTTTASADDGEVTNVEQQPDSMSLTILSEPEVLSNLPPTSSPPQIIETIIEEIMVDATTEESEGVIVDAVSASDELADSTTEIATGTEMIDEVTDEVDNSTTPPEAINSSDNNLLNTETVSEDMNNQVTTIPNGAPLTTIEYTVTNDENRYSFAREECVAMGEGTFYCAKAEQGDTPVVTERVFAEADEQGDLEIFVDFKNQRKQITNNEVDDDAPTYDVESNSLVWHRLLDGRYQIVSYDLSTNKETLLTNDRFNNMYPSRHRDATVWQSWVGNDWDIMLEVGGVVTMLSDNAVPDIAPKINGDFVIWQAFENGAWKVKVYNRSTGVVDTIADADGASVQNPRFVLVYDAKHNNGDVETLGYDLAGKVAVPLSATSKPAPKNIPEPEQTGEERALVQPTTSLKQKTETVTDGGANDDDIPEPPETNLATTTPDIVIPPYSEVVDENITATEDNIPAETDDEEAPALDVTMGVEEAVIVPDLIITPYGEPIETTTDPQEEVASL